MNRPSWISCANSGKEYPEIPCFPAFVEGLSSQFGIAKPESSPGSECSMIGFVVAGLGMAGIEPLKWEKVHLTS